MREMRTLCAQAAIVAGEVHRRAGAGTGQSIAMAAALGHALCKRRSSIVDAVCAGPVIWSEVWMGRSGTVGLAMLQGCSDLSAGCHQPQDRAGRGPNCSQIMEPHMAAAQVPLRLCTPSLYTHCTRPRPPATTALTAPAAPAAPAAAPFDRRHRTATATRLDLRGPRNVPL